MTPVENESPLANVANLAIAARWRSLDTLYQQSSLSKKSKRSSLYQDVLNCLRVPPYDDSKSCADLQKLAKIDSRVASFCAIFRASLSIAYKHVLCDDSRGAINHAQSAILGLIDVVAASGELLADNEAEIMIGRSHSMVNYLSSQAELQHAINRLQMPQKLVFVLGMHRSGTSALSGFLVKSGLSAPLDLMPAGPNNPKGYWESLSICQENDRFLSQIGSHWSSSLFLPLGWPTSDASKKWRSELVRLIAKVFQDADLPLIKDPRLCILIKGLEPWLESGLLNPCFLIPIRHPLEVAFSLEKAEGLSIELGLKLWIRSLFDAESATRGFNRQFISFDQLINDPPSVLAKCMNVIDSLKCQEVVCMSQLQSELCMEEESISFVDPNLQHQRINTIRDSLVRSRDVQVDRLIRFAAEIYAEVSMSTDGATPANFFESHKLESIRLVS